MRHTAKTITAVSLALFMTACGTSSHGGTSQDNAPEATTATKPQVKLDPDQEALYIDTIQDLGTCDGQNLNQLVYVKEDNQFRSCEKDGWKVVSLKGKDGAQGAAGKDGSRFQNAWKDMIKGRTWFIGSTTTKQAGAAPTQGDCPTGTTHPNGGDMTEAWTNGLGAAFDGMGLTNHTIWLDYVRLQINGAWVNHIYMFTDGSTQDATLVPDAVTGYNVCYKDGV